MARVKAVYPYIYSVIDRYPVEAYFQQVWDYHGKWYADSDFVRVNSVLFPCSADGIEV